MSPDYEPQEYWSDRLGTDFSLRGTGHAGFSEHYNFWLYRQKARGLGAALEGVPGGAHALDIGSGVGWGVQQLLDRGLHVEGCDITDVAVDRLTKQFPQVPFFQVALGSQPVPRDDASFDLITLLDVAYHITDDTIWQAAVADMARLLKPGGRLVITDQLGETSRRAGAHVQLRSLAAWQQAAGAIGMELSAVGPLYTWLSRPADVRGWRLLPGAVRGAFEYLHDARLPQGAPHLRWATLTKRR